MGVVAGPQLLEVLTTLPKAWTLPSSGERERYCHPRSCLDRGLGFRVQGGIT